VFDPSAAQAAPLLRGTPRDRGLGIGDRDRMYRSGDTRSRVLTAQQLVDREAGRVSAGERDIGESRVRESD
jgi:hypothetical protein